VGRLVGVLLLLHLGLGLTVPFIMLHPLISQPGFLASASGVANQTRTAVLIFFVGGALAIAIASAGWRVFREYSSAMALWLFALAAKADVFQALALVVGSARKWSHYSFLLVVGCWILLLFSLLFRFRLVPRVLAAFGMLGALLQIAGVSLRGLLGYPPETRLAMPLAPAYLLLALWLMVKGFDERQRPLSADADGASAGPTQ
jgi:hypothetical protein